MNAIKDLEIATLLANGKNLERALLADDYRADADVVRDLVSLACDLLQSTTFSRKDLLAELARSR